MGQFTLFDEAILSDIPEVEDPVFSSEASLESLAVPTSTEIKDGQIIDADGPKPGVPSPAMLIQYTISPLNSGTGKMVTFYLNLSNLTDIIVNQFVLMSDILVKPEDVMFIHLNSILDAPVAYLLNNAIRACRAKAKIACNPYVLNTAGVYPMLACDFIMPCRFGIMKFDACSVMAGGAGHIDAKNALEFDTNRKMELLSAANKAGFLPDDRLQYILEKQGSYSLFGEPLLRAIRFFNNRKR